MLHMPGSAGWADGAHNHERYLLLPTPFCLLRRSYQGSLTKVDGLVRMMSLNWPIKIISPEIIIYLLFFFTKIYPNEEVNFG